GAEFRRRPPGGLADLDGHGPSIGYHSHRYHAHGFFHFSVFLSLSFFASRASTASRCLTAWLISSTSPANPKMFCTRTGCSGVSGPSDLRPERPPVSKARLAAAAN